MNEFIAIITNPILYCSLIGILIAFYTVWAMARQQYLGVDKLFNLLALSLAAGWFASWIAQSITNQIWQENLSLSQLWVNPQPLANLASYLGIWLVATRYVRSIRYPYWRLMDMLFVAISIIQSALLLGWVIQEFNWYSAIAAIVSIIVCVGLVWLYYKLPRSGIVAGVQSATFFAIMLFLYFTLPAWQEQGSGVEWVADIVGIVLGAILVILRISARSEKAILQDIPRGVSQSFQETFTRAFSKKPVDPKSKK